VLPTGLELKIAHANKKFSTVFYVTCLQINSGVQPSCWNRKTACNLSNFYLFVYSERILYGFSVMTFFEHFTVANDQLFNTIGGYFLCCLPHGTDFCERVLFHTDNFGAGKAR